MYHIRDINNLYKLFFLLVSFYAPRMKKKGEPEFFFFVIDINYCCKSSFLHVTFSFAGTQCPRCTIIIAFLTSSSLKTIKLQNRNKPLKKNIFWILDCFFLRNVSMSRITGIYYYEFLSLKSFFSTFSFPLFISMTILSYRDDGFIFFFFFNMAKLIFIWMKNHCLFVATGCNTNFFSIFNFLRSIDP